MDEEDKNQDCPSGLRAIAAAIVCVGFLAAAYLLKDDPSHVMTWCIVLAALCGFAAT